jgi:hypothetical protein
MQSAPRPFVVGTLGYFSLLSLHVDQKTIEPEGMGKMLSRGLFLSAYLSFWCSRGST